MTESPLRGIGLMVAATICFSVSDALAKHLVVSIPAIQIGWMRYVVFTIMATLPLLRGGRVSVRTRRPRMQAARGLGIVVSSIAFILGLSHLPLAEAAAVSFASPLFITLLAIPLLGEAVGPAGWTAVLVGFAGVLIVIRPGLSGFHPAAFLVLLSSLAWAGSMIVTRRMAGTERPAATVLWTAGTGLVALSVLLPWEVVPVSLGQAGFAVLLGLVASSGQFLAVWAYREANASVLAPLSYGQIIWSGILGYVAFGTTPDRWTLVGAAIIVASGLYAVNRERRRVRASSRDHKLPRDDRATVPDHRPGQPVPGPG